MEDKGIFATGTSALGDEYKIEHMFKLYKKDEKYMFNIGKKIIVPTDLDPSLYTNARWYKQPLTTLSNTAYGTPDLWWIILYANGIYNPLNLPENGAIIKIPSPAFVRYVLDAIKLELANSQ